MRDKLEQLGKLLLRDGLERGEFMIMAYASIWLEPMWSYRDILEVYADYVNDAPERVHAALCYHLLAAGREIGPEQYFKELKMEVERENGVLIEQGSGACFGSSDTGKQTCHAGSTGHRAPDQ